MMVYQQAYEHTGQAKALSKLELRASISVFDILAAAKPAIFEKVERSALVVDRSLVFSSGSLARFSTSRMFAAAGPRAKLDAFVLDMHCFELMRPLLQLLANHLAVRIGQQLCLSA